MRTLSMNIVKNGALRSTDTASQWMHIPPESNGETLHALVCNVTN
jgi:hypothetical protein